MTTQTDIHEVFAWEALDSRGTPTVACQITLVGGATGTVVVPSGASTGTHEATELRDGGDRYGGRGVLTAVRNVTGPLAGAVQGIDATAQADVDAALRDADGTSTLSKLGANAILAVSIATARAAADAIGQPLHDYVAAPGGAPLLPMPMVNIISGGAHAARGIDVQDFLVIPMGANTFAEAMEIAWRVRNGASIVVANKGHNVALIADEGGLGPVLPSNRCALELLAAGIEYAGLELGTDAAIAIDVAATEFYDPSTMLYEFAAEHRKLTATELVDEIRDWCNDFPIVSVEDVLAEDDWENWSKTTSVLSNMQIVGDDLFATNPERLRRGIMLNAANAVLVKPNQIGTLTEAREVVAIAHEAGFATVLSARSGDTEDPWLSDLAVGWRTGQIKVGSTMRAERTAKWNRLLQIEARLGGAAGFAGKEALAPNH